MESDTKPMTLYAQENGDVRTPPPQRPKQKRRCLACFLATLLLLATLVLLGVILGLTVFKVKKPKTELLSASVRGVAPRLSFPAVKVELNVTLNLTLLIKNPNHASFRAGQGQSSLLYGGEQVGDAQLDPGFIPARGSTTLGYLLTLEIERFTDSSGRMSSLIKDIMAGQLPLEVKVRVPGRVKIFIFKKHIVTSADCQIVIGFPDLKIKSQECNYHTKL